MKKSAWVKIFQNLTGYPLLSRVQKEIVDDFIDIKKWNINMDYVKKDVRRDDIVLDDEDSEIKKLREKVDPLFEKIWAGINGENLGDYPEALFSDRDRYGIIYFLAAYPDVFEWFNPTIDYQRLLSGEKSSKELTDEVIALTEQTQDAVNLVQEQFLKNGGDEEDFVGFLITLKNYYRDVLKKPFSLARQDMPNNTKEFNK